MPHPRMYADDDVVLTRLRRLCAALPESVEKESHGRPTFRASPAGKLYAAYGSGRAKGLPEHPHALLVLPDEEERPALVDDPRFFVPPYYGPAGWLAIDLTPTSDWREVAELLASSYRRAAPARLVRALDDGGLAPVLAAADAR